MNIPAFTEHEARVKRCPYEIDHCCITTECMGWVMSERRMEREDHSGANMLMIDEQARRAPGSEIKRSGPPGSSGILYLEARGYCRRLWAEAKEV